MCRGGRVPFCRYINMYGESLQNQTGDWKKAKKILLSIANDSNQAHEKIIALCYLLSERRKLNIGENKLLDDITCRLENREVLDEAQRMIASQ